MEKIIEKADSIEIVVSRSATIPIANFENLKPMYSLKAVFGKEALTDNEIKQVVREMRMFEDKKLSDDFIRGQKMLIEKKRNDMRFYEIDGKLYPSVTTILNPYGIDYDPYLLSQYASRGTIVHYQAEEMMIELIKGTEIDDVELSDIERVMKLEDDVKLVRNGTLNLKWNDCNPLGFWKKYGKNIGLENAKVEKKIKNDKYLYAGTADLICKYRGKKAILDWKTSGSISGEKLEKYSMQIAAYAHCVGAEIGIIAPLKPKNKSGYGKPIVIDDIPTYWKKFTFAREKFREVHGL